MDDRYFPIHSEAHSLPYADEFFDVAISIDAYHYFGTDELYFPNYFSRLVKSTGQFGIVSPGLTKEFEKSVPQEMKHYWEPDMYTFHSALWWKDLWQKTGLADVTFADEIPEGKEIWRKDADFELLDSDKEGYLTLIMMTAIKK